MSNKVHVGMEMEEGFPGKRRDEWKRRFRVFGEETRRFPGKFGRIIWRVGREDPRRVIHSLKVGLSLTLVSLLYLMEPLFKGVGGNAIWAVMTVVVVLEFTAGATLCKGLNRGLGTLIAGSLAFFIEFIANDSGRVFRAVFIGAAVFLIGSIATYVRFVPYIKKNYDYGVVIFLLTFNLITVSSYRVESVLRIAHERFYTIAIGCGVCLFMSLLVFPIWSGEDLHKSTIAKLEGLARCIEACVNEYFDESDKEEAQEEPKEDTVFKGYKAVLDSKSSDETLALYASWEPRHTRKCNRFPWEQYVKVGAVLRQFGYTAVALHGCLETEIQTPRSVRALFKNPCVRLAGEVSKVLTELAASIRNRRHCSPEILSDHLHVALQDLNSAIKSQPKLFLGSNLQHHRPQPPSKHQPQPPNSQNSAVSLSSVRTDTSALLEYWKPSKRGSQGNSDMAAAAAAAAAAVMATEHRKSRKGGNSDQPGAAERRMLRPQLSKIAVMTSLEFSEALPFAAFASMLVEMVARLDNVIEEVEELGRIACFKEYDEEDRMLEVKCEKPMDDVAARNHCHAAPGDG